MIELSREVLFAGIAIAVAIMRYVTYLHSIYKKETKPHLFSWFNWSLIVGIGAYAQYTLNGGLSVWTLVIVASTSFMIAILSLWVGEKNITRSDWIAFVGALFAVPVWMATDNALYALMILIFIDFLSYYPTIRKSWNDPWGEPPLSYFWSGSRYFFTLFAVPEFTFDTLVYPFFLMAMEWIFVAYLIWRRTVLK